jgi:O-antigen ligase
MVDFFRKYRMLIFMFLIWALAGAYVGTVAAIIVSVASFLLLAKRADSGQLLVALLVMLIFSDSRSQMLQFAVQAKVFFALSALLFVLLRWKDMAYGSQLIFRFFLPFLMFAMLLVPFANDSVDAFQKTLSYVIIFLVVPTLFITAHRDDAKFPLDLVVFFFLILVVGIILRFISPEFVTLVDRFRGLLGNPNGLGIFLTLIFPISYMILESPTAKPSVRNRLIFYAAIIVSLLLCQSRTAILSCGLFLLFNSFQALRKGLGLLLFLAIIFSFEYLLSQIPLVIIALNLGEYFRIDSLLEGSGRLVAWEFGWEQIQKVFFFGGGFDYTNDLYKQYYVYLSRLGHQGNAHNSFLTLWLDTGIIGLSLFAVGLARIVLLALKQTNYTLPVLYGILFSTNFESWLAASLNPFTSLFLIALTILSNPELITQSPISKNASA